MDIPQYLLEEKGIPLSDQQRQAVEAEGGEILLLAVPGAPMRSRARSVTRVEMAISTSRWWPMYLGVMTVSPTLPPQM